MCLKQVCKTFLSLSRQHVCLSTHHTAFAPSSGDSFRSVEMQASCRVWGLIHCYSPCVLLVKIASRFRSSSGSSSTHFLSIAHLGHDCGHRCHVWLQYQKYYCWYSWCRGICCLGLERACHDCWYLFSVLATFCRSLILRLLSSLLLLLLLLLILLLLSC
jgi:hypothetical protein